MATAVASPEKQVSLTALGDVMANKRVGIVTVHGTGDTAEGGDGDKWFQNGSAFAQRLKARLAEGASTQP